MYENRDSGYMLTPLHVRGSVVKPEMRSTRGSLPPPPRKNSDREPPSSLTGGADTPESDERKPSEADTTSTSAKTLLVDGSALDLPFAKNGKKDVDQSTNISVNSRQQSNGSLRQGSITDSVDDTQYGYRQGAGAQPKTTYSQFSPDTHSRSDSGSTTSFYDREQTFSVVGAVEPYDPHNTVYPYSSHQGGKDNTSGPSFGIPRSDSGIPISSPSQFTSMIFSGYLLKQNRHKRFQKRYV